MTHSVFAFLSPCRLWQAGRYAWQGLRCAIHERAFKLELLLTPPIAVMAFYLGEGGVQRALLMLSWLLVPMAELLNTAVEKLADRIATTDDDRLIGQAKDLGAAAVLWALLTAVVVWLCVLFGGG